MIKVAPSILSADFVNLERDIRKLKECGADYVHVDVMDGLFVPNISIGIPVVSAIRKITDLPLDVHLMIQQPIRYVEQFCDAGADILTIHAEADTVENNQKALRMIREKGVRAAVSIKPGTPISALEPYMELMDMILVMTVEPGFGGQKFMEDMMEKVRALRKLMDVRMSGVELEVDGGVNLDTGKICVDAGANVLVAGSALFKAPDTAAFIDGLHKLV
ncbi:MAG: ribulose-phosphate 3-epimerase [Oscillospiraceae bacterium]|nr:ribulose-phosphate 3-epimerase [Oscillospiraceae bacterium]